MHPLLQNVLPATCFLQVIYFAYFSTLKMEEEYVPKKSQVLLAVHMGSLATVFIVTADNLISNRL
jgi:hypothetical protein